ncbi:MAG: putative quinol monooxygenase [Dehalococcoidia bacterium]
MYILMVRIKVKPDKVDDFKQASIGDARGSVLDEPGCRRFDVIQDLEDPTLFAFCEVYNDQAAVDDHLTRPHFKKWQEAIKDMVDGETGVSRCRPVFPVGDAKWDAYREGAVDDPAFASSLHVIHAPLPIKADKVDDFIAAVKLDGIGSTHEEPGCLRFDVYQNIEKPDELYLYEVYVNQPAFEYHTKTPHIAKWRETVKDWYAGERTGSRRGRNVWPPDNWGWSSGQPRA